MKTLLTQCKRIVVKVGSSLVTNQGEGLDVRAIGNWAQQIATLRKSGYEVVLVSSGAIASACVVGFGTGIGLPFRLTDLGYVQSVMFNQTAITISSTAVKVADVTTPATTSTTDVRGYIVTGQTDGTKRLIINYSLPAIACGPYATRIGAVGVTQV